MSDEELAMCLYEIGYDGGWGTLEGTLKWLQQPAEELTMGLSENERTVMTDGYQNRTLS